MDDSKKEFFRQLLVEEKKNIERTINLMEEHGISKQNVESADELSGYDNHPAELGTQLFQTELNNALKVHEERLLEDINEALTKMDKGSFGKCELCGKEIDEERLEALPYTRLCIDCENAKESSDVNLDRQRPVEELIWDAPFGRKYLNKQEDDENEGMDQFNDLVKYGSSDTPQDMGGYYDFDEYYTNELDKQGIVDIMDNISNEEYKKQLP
ncbi:MAG TPA: conjugal transfer protein TraR [Hungateiclostridium thermocellum]|uniref:Transcriptional regulator, TraR/DksA family n=2 Tax=Acetivibrio thermocellus TaxID=1515 RepID=A3DD29_ACET2|nr:TraR/DksA C4-type zinc finger protein [Acetivibrio thermocellus]CDG35314.1 TraR/DksA family transcriptional regulator [Acetivibrio thermocellus BC1]ABN51858.1 transcriptional regulator, TraR/DksA family [Acetivibrio thermocellus ATCC 27405]ADU74666.1 transcriptional regulator, TraR/DksA family [Acetivibrio thermocellus DSM 1313]ALX08609.1 transcriptional regulator, TraR/DksA family [Acetivibrio thermocellus AD2]ANV76358.1 transcriptional regulator, TraR/DksA family [Acetivibrio thermocellus